MGESNGGDSRDVLDCTAYCAFVRMIADLDDKNSLKAQLFEPLIIVSPAATAVASGKARIVKHRRTMWRRFDRYIR